MASPTALSPVSGSKQGQPLVLTLALEERAQIDFDQQRRRYFPASLNRIPAHVTLFHALPGDELLLIEQWLGKLAAATAPFSVTVKDVQKLGRGVAYTLHADPLAALHAELRQACLPWLTAQDAQGFRPHVVIQNKVDPAEARALYERLAASFRPYTIQAIGLLLWRYLNGPWALEREFPFLPR